NLFTGYDRALHREQGPGGLTAHGGGTQFMDLERDNVLQTGSFALDALSNEESKGAARRPASPPKPMMQAQPDPMAVGEVAADMPMMLPPMSKRKSAGIGAVFAAPFVAPVAAAAGAINALSRSSAPPGYGGGGPYGGMPAASVDAALSHGDAWLDFNRLELAGPDARARGRLEPRREHVAGASAAVRDI